MNANFFIFQLSHCLAGRALLIFGSDLFCYAMAR